MSLVKHLVIGAVAFAASPWNGKAQDVDCPSMPADLVNCTGAQSAGEYLQALLTTSNYDKTLRPYCGSADAPTEGPTIVEVQYFLSQLNKIDAKLGTITMSGYFRTWWTDPRLAFPSIAEGGCFDSLVIMGSDSDGIWSPDIYIDNLIEKETGAGFAILMQISPDGSVWRSEQLLVTVMARMDLGKLPYDSQIAKVVVASYSQPITELRTIARGGTVGAGESGIGIVASQMSSVIWSFPSDETENPDDGFTTPGQVELLFNGSWDYLTMSFSYSRKAKYFVDQVIVPSILFLLVSYMQFFVDASAAPARAALAVIPVLIMRTMGNSVYRTLPEGSQKMWLGDFLITAMFMCVGAALEFCFVQIFLMKEARRKAKLEGLLNTKELAQKLMNEAKAKKLSLFNVLSKYEPAKVQVSTAELAAKEKQDMKESAEAQMEEDFMNGIEGDDPGATPGSPAARSDGLAAPGHGSTGGDMVTMRRRSDEAKKSSICESDLVFIRYVHSIFSKYDKDNSNSLSPAEVRMALRYFNLYFYDAQTAAVICMFLRDSGEKVQGDESMATMTFSKFAALLMNITDYKLAARKPGTFFGRIKASFQSKPPSEVLDTVMRFFFPFAIFVIVVTFYALLPIY